MMINLASIPVDLASLHRTASDRGMFRGRKFDAGAALHRFVRETFGADALLTFRLMAPAGSPAGTIYAYSTQNADQLREIAGSAATPDSTSIFRLASAKTTTRPPSKWRSGQRLGLSVRCRPTRRSSLVGDQTTSRGRREAEVDAYLHDLAAFDKGHLDEKPTRESAYIRWFREKLMGEASPHAGAVTEARIALREIIQSDVFRKGRWSHGPDVTFEVEVTVGDPEAFSRLLEKGMGRHKAYGYGMVLVRPPKSC